MSQLRPRLLGFGATLAILLLVIGTPVVLIAIGATPWRGDYGSLGTLLTSPDDGTLAIVVIGVVAWVGWAVMTVSLLIEFAARVRGIPAPTLRGFALPQLAASQLIAVASLLFVAVPVVASSFPAPPAHASPPPQTVAEAPRLPVAELQPATPAVAAIPLHAEPAKPGPTTIDYTVKRGDSLWKIADRLLGDGARYVEIVNLNTDVLNGRPDFIVAGTVLRIPHEAAEPVAQTHSAETYVVEPGDTLSEIALDELGDPLRYPEIFEASRHTVQPDGARLRDPNLIRPGWELTIPGASEDTAPNPTMLEVDPPPAEPPVDHSPIRPTDPAEPGPTAEPTHDPAEAPATITPDQDDEDVSSDSSPGWLIPGLTGSGAVLAGALLLALRAHRRTQWRCRRPGQTIAPPPQQLGPIEKTAGIEGTSTAPAIGQLDRLLRHLAAWCETTEQPRPTLAAVELGSHTVTMHLATPANLPEPWRGADMDWTAMLDSAVDDEDQLSPYPLLVSVGQDDDGHLWLLDLESLRTVALVGDPSQTESLARHVAAELALSPWAVLVDIDTISLSPELVPIDPMRLHDHDPDDSEFLQRLRKTLEAAQDAGVGNPEPFHALIVSNEPRCSDEVQAVVQLVRGQSVRAGAAVLSIGGTPEPEDAVIEVTRDGRLSAPGLDHDLQAAGLTPEEASACAAIVDLTRQVDVVPIPADSPTTSGWRALADHAGALRTELTEPRPAGAAGNTSLLPDSNEGYEALAATTVEDVQTLGPVVPEQSRLIVEDADPQLDNDLAEWLDHESLFPKLTLLGAVTASARGDLKAIVERKPYFVELLAFLALHPDGVSAAEVADAFSIGTSRARTDIGFVRRWLATSSYTGRPHLPAANASRVYEQTHVTAYQVEDVLVDWDLFRRLRARGQARGAEGIGDLEAALQLVAGQPFDHLRERGWSWLLDGERLHETAACAVVDTAHIVVVDALANADLARARSAAETACRAAPYDDVARLDLIKVAEAEGHADAAEHMLRDDIFNRTDDHLPPIDLPGRTDQVVKNHGWGTPRRSSNR